MAQSKTGNTNGEGSTMTMPGYGTEGETRHEGADSWIPDTVPARDTEHELVSGLNLMAKLNLQLGKKVDEVSEKVGSLQKRLYSAPVRYTAVGSAAPTTFQGTAGSFFMVLGSPDQGTFWEVNSLSAGFTSWADDDANNIVANDVFVCISGVSDPVSIPTTAIAWHEASTYDGTTGQTVVGLPIASTFGANQLTVRDNEYLVVIIAGASAYANKTGVASARMTVYDEVLGADDVTINA